MPDVYHVAVIGAGMWGTVHLETFAYVPRTRVTWICDKRADRVAEAQKRFDIPNGTPDYRQALEDPQVDAVVIASPPDTHVDMAIDTLQAGKHLLLEKPMAITRSGMYRLLAEAEQHPDRVLLEASCRHARLQPKYRFIKAFIESGKLGEIYHIHYDFVLPGTFIEYNPAGTWAVRKKTAGGGPFIDFAVYDLSFHLGVLGDRHNIQKVNAFHRNDLRDLSAIISGADVEQHGAAYLEFDRGLTFYIERGNGALADIPCQSRIYGTRGTLVLNWPSWTSNMITHFYTDARQQVQRETIEVDMTSHRPPADTGTVNDDNLALLHHFVDCLDGRATPAMPIRRAAKHLDILLRILKSE
ncbi:MAG: Gfo/Idh/MocA family protein [Chloroflexota bacterium]